MNPVNPGITAILVAFSPISPLALPSHVGAALASTLAPLPQPSVSIIYKNAMTESRMPNIASEDMPSGSADTNNFLSRVRNNRVNNLSMEIQLPNMCFNNDRATFKLYAPMETANRVLSVAKTVPRISLDDSQATWVQTLLLASRRQINAELGYSVKMNRHSSFDSAIIYRLNPDTASGKPDTVASLRYSVQF